MCNVKQQTIYIVLTAGLSACSHNIYIAPQDAPLADISFSSLMPGSSEILLRTNCRNYLIGKSSIERRKPTAPSKNNTAFRAGVALKFRYDHIDIGDSRSDVSSLSLLNSQISLKEKREVHSCSDEVIFVPEANKRYEVYFGTDTWQCHIFVKQVDDVDAVGNKTLIDVVSSSATVC